MEMPNALTPNEVSPVAATKASPETELTAKVAGTIYSHRILSLPIVCSHTSALVLDFDECSYQNGDCAQICTNDVGTHSCTCLPGFEPDGYNCLGMPVPTYPSNALYLISSIIRYMT